MSYRVMIEASEPTNFVVLETESLVSARASKALAQRQIDDSPHIIEVNIYMRETIIDVNGFEKVSWTYVI